MEIPETHYAKTPDGVHIAYQVLGGGPIDLVLIPDGFIPIDSMYEEPHLSRFLKRIASFSRLILFDPRGVGSSDRTEAGHPPTLEQWMEDVVAVHGAVGATTCAFVGLAEGGFVAAMTTATHPDRARSLVLVNSTPGVLNEAVRDFGVRGQNMGDVRQQDALDLAEDSVTGGIADFAPSAATDVSYKKWLARAWRRAVSPSTFTSIGETMYGSDIASVLPAILVPTLVIHRAGDRWFGPEHGRYLAKHIPGARYVEVAGDDHVPYLGDQDAILDEIEEFITGTRPAPESDRVLATVLMTDIVESTSRTASVGDRAWRDLLDRHDAIVRTELDRHRGKKVNSIGLGDGVLATFDGPARACRCAAALHESIRSSLGVDIRAGLHTGEIELRGDDVTGMAVNIAARVMGLASASETLVSRTVTDLVAGSGLEFADKGEHELKGVPGKWAIYAVRS